MRRETKGRAWLVFSAMMLIRYAGLALGPVLIVDYPLSLVLASPFLHHLTLAAATSPLLPWLLLASFATVLHAVVGYALGRSLGSMSESWLARRWPRLRKRLGREHKSPWLPGLVLLLAVPGPLVSATLGAVGVARRAYIPALVVSQAIWLVLCLRVGQSLTGTVTSIHEFLVSFGVPLAIAIAGVASARAFWLKRRAEPA